MRSFEFGKRVEVAVKCGVWVEETPAKLEMDGGLFL